MKIVQGTIKNFYIAVKEKNGELIFLRRIIEGTADRSYGIHVARLAGIPKSVTRRAEEILNELESNRIVESKPEIKKSEPNLFETQSRLIEKNLQEKILSLDVMSMTPIEAMNFLYKLQTDVKNEVGE